MGIYSMATSQSEHDKFPWGRISLFISTSLPLFAYIYWRTAFRKLPEVSGNANLAEGGKTKTYFDKPSKATITRCDLSPRFFCNDATLLCEFESDKIWINEFE